MLKLTLDLRVSKYFPTEVQLFNSNFESRSNHRRKSLLILRLQLANRKFESQLIF